MDETSNEAMTDKHYARHHDKPSTQVFVCVHDCFVPTTSKYVSLLILSLVLVWIFSCSVPNPLTFSISFVLANWRSRVVIL